MTLTRTWLLRAADLTALVALIASLAITGNRLSGGGDSSAPVAGAGAARAAQGAAGDRDGDGVPDAQDLAPDTPAPGSNAESEAFSRAPVGGDCERKGITRKRGREGLCMEDSGRSVRVVDLRTPLRVDEFGARIVRMSVRNKPSDASARVRFDMALSNRLGYAADVQPSQFRILLGRGVYAPDLLAPGRGANSLFRRGTGLKPGRTAVGSVTFSVTHRAARNLDRDGNLEVMQFSDTSFDRAALTVGVFRTYR